MVKLGKEYSDAFGFKLVGHFTGFIKQYPVEGAKVQKICDESFLEACKKSYPLILSTGVDPATYRPKEVATLDVRDELRRLFPIKKEVVVVEDDSTSSCEEEEDEEDTFSPSNSPRITKPNLKKVEIGSRCTSCSFKSKENEELKKELEKLKNENAELKKENEELKKQPAVAKKDLADMKLKNDSLSKEVEALKKDKTKLAHELQEEKKTATYRLTLYTNLMKDPDYQKFNEFRQFEAFKRKRTQ